MSDSQSSLLGGLGGAWLAGQGVAIPMAALGSSLHKTTGTLSDSNVNILKDILRREVGSGVDLRLDDSMENLFHPGKGNRGSFRFGGKTFDKPFINLPRNNSSLSVGLHEIGHAMDTKSRLADILRSNKVRIGGGALSSLSVVPAAMLGSQIADNNVSANTALTTAGMAGLGSLPIIAEEIRATRNANRLAKKYRLSRLRGLKRALGTYGISAIAPATIGLGFGLGSRMMGSK